MMLMCTTRTLYILPIMIGFLPFQPLTTFIWFRVFLPTTHWFVSCPPTTTYLCQLCHSPLPDKEDCFVCLLTMAFLSTAMWVFSLAIPHGMHLVVPTHPSFFWVVCHPSRTSPPKESEQESQNKLSLLPPPNHTFSFLRPMTHHSYIGWVQVGGAWALHMLHFPCMSKACLLLMCLPWSEGSSVHFVAHP